MSPAIRILVVDDEPDLNEAICDMLAMFGFEATGCHGATQAEAQLARQAWDLLLVDLHLPDLDGATLAARARSQHPALPVVLMSGDRVPASGFPHLAKPFSAAALVAAVQRALGAPGG